MRGVFQDQGGLFSYVSPEARVPSGHPLRKMRELVRDVLMELNRGFARFYAKDGRPSVAPEQLVSALLIQALYGIRLERQLMEQLNYNLLYRWFVGLPPNDPVWDPTTFTKNRERLQAGEVFEKFMTRLLNHPQVKPLLSDEHFSVDGTLIEAWASQRSFRPKNGSDEDGSDFHGQTRKPAGASLAMQSWPVRSRGFMSGVLQGSWGIGFAMSALIFATCNDLIGWRGMLWIGVLPALAVVWARKYVKAQRSGWRIARSNASSSAKCIHRCSRSSSRGFSATRCWPAGG